MNASSRYAGKPLLRLLEGYVLRAIGALSPGDEERLRSMEPQLGRVYGRVGTWMEIIASEMELPANMPELIAETWRRNQNVAKANGLELTAQQFAEMFVDQNLVG
jgi:hypothetical protein